jgi:hypothetical protein
MMKVTYAMCVCNLILYICCHYVIAVYAATRKKDGRRVALKFFGYTKRLATPDDIQHEIDLMAALKGVEGFIQTEGVFWDTVDGIVPESKQHAVACPVIVMELMEGVSRLCRVALYCAVSCDVVKYSTVQCSTVRCSAVQHKHFIYISRDVCALRTYRASCSTACML